AATSPPRSNGALRRIWSTMSRCWAVIAVPFIVAVRGGCPGGRPRWLAPRRGCGEWIYLADGAGEAAGRPVEQAAAIGPGRARRRLVPRKPGSRTDPVAGAVPSAGPGPLPGAQLARCCRDAGAGPG